MEALRHYIRQVKERAAKHEKQDCDYGPVDVMCLVAMLELLLKSIETARQEIKRLYPKMKDEDFNRAFDKIMGIPALERLSRGEEP